MGLHRPFQRAGAVDGVVADVGQGLFCLVREGDVDALLGQALFQPVDLDIGDGGEVIALQGVEHHQVVNPVEEFRPEIGGYDFQHRGLHGLVIRLAGLFPDAVRAQVRGHDDDGVAEVDGPALTVGQAPVVQHLQQHVENVGVGFFNLVQQRQAVRPAPHLFGKLAALVITDVARRRTDEPGHRVLLHVFGHVDADDGVLAVEQEIRQRPAQLRLADAGGSEEKK